MTQVLAETICPDNIEHRKNGANKKFSDSINLKSIALASIAHLLDYRDSSESMCPEQKFLFGYFLKFSDQEFIRQHIPEYLKHPQAEDQGLVSLANKLRLEDLELLTISLALAVEEDPMVGRAIAYMQAPVGGSRPTLGLLESAFALIVNDTDEQWIAGSILSGMAVRSGILNMLNTDAPLPEQSIQVPGMLVLALHKKDFLWPGTRNFDDASAVILPESICQQAQQHAVALLSQHNNILAIRSASIKEARSVAFEVCRHFQLEPLFFNTESVLLKGLGPLCLVNGRIPVFEFDLAPAETQYVTELPGYDGCGIVILGPDGNIESQSGSLLHWTVSTPNQKEREVLWQGYLEDKHLARQLASDHVHSAGRIMELSQLSFREARLNNRIQPDIEDIRQAAWMAEGGNLSSLAQAITTRIPDEALVLPANTKKELDYLMQRCKNRESLGEELGITIRAGYKMGVKALLVGPSGTGKTLVASWIATRLGLPLFRVDLASVVSKYIGETEKNLATLLAKAEQSEVVLLFDEADSLFGKRTDIKDSNDRHANSQTNYLLQRIEFYKGIVLLTSNSRGRFDSAFTRRLDKVIEFALPAPEQRRALWQAHLGSKQMISMKQLNQLAVGSDLAGGYIRNAVLSAAVQAKATSRQISFDDIAIGLESEYRKLGRQLPSEIRQYQKRQ